jgi:hypothetical protein
MERVVLSTFRQKLIETLIAEEGAQCRYCRVKVRTNLMERERHDNDATVDHIIPKARGGTNSPNNLALCCRRCNHAKADRSVEEFLADPRPESLRAAEKRKGGTRRHTVRTIAVPDATKRGEKVIRGTLAWAIKMGEVTDHGTYRRKLPSTAPGSDPRPRGRKMSAGELAKWLRESAERKGKAWPLT